MSSIPGRQGRHEKGEETPKGRVGVRKLGQNQPPPKQRPATEMLRRVWTMLEEPNIMGSCWWSRNVARDVRREVRH